MARGLAGWLGLLGLALLGRPAPAAQGADPGAPAPAVARPDFLRNRPTIPVRLLEDKREGTYVTGIPAIGFDTEEGFNLGAFLELYDNGSKEDPFFRTTPYRRKLLVGAVVTTEEVLRLVGRLDWPNIRDSPNRFRIDALFEASDHVNYFGIGDDGRKLRSPRTGITYREYDDYQRDLDTLVPSGTPACPAGRACTNARYNRYGSQDLTAVLSLERDTLGGLVRPLVGFQLRWVDASDLTGERVQQIDGSRTARQLPTKLLADCQSGIVDGCRGGWDNYLKLGLSYDSRDFEPNPTRGVVAEAIVALSAKAFGSQGDYQRITLSGSAYRDLFEPLDTAQSLIAAARVTYHMTFGDPPFFALPKLGFTDFDRAGLGGFLTLRGFRERRLVGDSAALVNGELRWFFTKWRFWGQELRPGFAGFLDTGRAYDGVKLDLSGWKLGGGGGFRLAWNLATLVSFDVGVSREDLLLYLELGTQF